MTETTNLTVGGSEMEMLIARPEGPGPHPGLIMGIHAPAYTGLEADRFTVYAAERYAAQGYMTIAPFLFHRYPLDGERQVKIDGLRDDNILADMNAARDFLGAMEDVDNDRIGVLGH